MLILLTANLRGTIILEFAESQILIDLAKIKKLLFQGSFAKTDSCKNILSN